MTRLGRDGRLTDDRTVLHGGENLPAGQRLTAPSTLSDGDEILLGGVGVRMTFGVLPPVSTRTEAGG